MIKLYLHLKKIIRLLKQIRGLLASIEKNNIHSLDGKCFSDICKKEFDNENCCDSGCGIEEKEGENK